MLTATANAAIRQIAGSVRDRSFRWLGFRADERRSREQIRIEIRTCTEDDQKSFAYAASN